MLAGQPDHAGTAGLAGFMSTGHADMQTSMNGLPSFFEVPLSMHNMQALLGGLGEHAQGLGPSQLLRQRRALRAHLAGCSGLGCRD